MTTEAQRSEMLEKGQMVRVEFLDEYGHGQTETVEVENVSVDGTMFSATYMAYGRDVYLREPTENATILRARVVVGWNVTHDFETMEEALQFAAKEAREPVRDPALRRVTLIDMTERGKDGSFSNSITVKCPAPKEASAR